MNRRRTPLRRYSPAHSAAIPPARKPRRPWWRFTATEIRSALLGVIGGLLVVVLGSCLPQ